MLRGNCLVHNELGPWEPGRRGLHQGLRAMRPGLSPGLSSAVARLTLQCGPRLSPPTSDSYLSSLRFLPGSVAPPTQVTSWDLTVHPCERLLWGHWNSHGVGTRGISRDASMTHSWICRIQCPRKSSHRQAILRSAQTHGSDSQKRHPVAPSSQVCICCKHHSSPRRKAPHVAI